MIWSMPRFTLRRLLLMVVCFSVTFAVVLFLQSRDLGILGWLPMFVGGAGCGAAIGLLWDHPIIGAFVGAYLIPAALWTMVFVGVALGWITLP